MFTCSMLLANSFARVLLHTETRTCEHMCSHTHRLPDTRTHIHNYSHPQKNIPRDSLHLCQHSILPALTSSVSHTLWSMQTSFESIYPSVLSLSLSLLSPCLCSSFALLSPPSLPSPLLVTYVLKIHISRFQTVHIVLSLTFSAVGRNPGKKAGLGGRSVCGVLTERDREGERVTDRQEEQYIGTDGETNRHTDKHKAVGAKTNTQRRIYIYIYIQYMWREMGVKTLTAHNRKHYFRVGKRGTGALAEGHRKEIKFNVLTELNKTHRQPLNYTTRLLCVGYDYSQYQTSICVCVCVCLHVSNSRRADSNGCHLPQ